MGMDRNLEHELTKVTEAEFLNRGCFDREIRQTRETEKKIRTAEYADKNFSEKQR
jgi:hypothetical protein